METSVVARETFEMAAEFQHHSATLFRRAAEFVEAPSARSLFQVLAVRADDHARTLRELGASLEGATAKPGPASQVPKGTKPEEFVKLAMARKQDCLVLYREILVALSDERSRKRLENLIREEQEYTVLLARELASLARGAR